MICELQCLVCARSYAQSARCALRLLRLARADTERALPPARAGIVGGLLWMARSMQRCADGVGRARPAAFTMQGSTRGSESRRHRGGERRPGLAFRNRNELPHARRCCCAFLAAGFSVHAKSVRRYAHFSKADACMSGGQRPPMSRLRFRAVCGERRATPLRHRLSGLELE